MAKRTKKVGPTGRFGARYGVRARVRFRGVETRQKAKHVCPDCGHPKIKRTDTSIWQCRKCALKFTGGAYVPRTDTGMGVDKSLQGVLDKLKGVDSDEAQAVEAAVTAKASGDEEED